MTCSIVSTMTRILVVDDLEVLLDVVKYILESNPGFTVDTANSVAQALKFLEEHDYDVIISDYCMPEVNGLEFLKQLRSMNITIPFILQTGQGDEITAMEALQYGADFFLEKGAEGPLQYLGFTQIINLLVAKRRSEERLLYSNYKFRNLFELNRDGLVYVDSEGIIMDVNPAFLEITGCSEDKIRNMSFHHLIPEEWTDIDTQALKEQIFTDGKSEEYNREYIRCDGDRQPISIRAQVLKNSRNEPEGMWIIVRDRSRDISTSIP